MLSITQLHELLKFPLLVEHYMEHKEQNNDLTLWNFLYMHYAYGDVKDADYDKDMKLPFKSHTNCPTTSLSVSLLHSIFTFALKKPAFFESKSSFYFGEQFLINAYLSSVWQPPKFC